MSLKPDDMLKLLRPAFQREIDETISKLYYEDFTDGEMAALAGMLRTVYERVEAGEKPPGKVLKLVQR
ncbi:hypothetical protein [Mycolicibacterium sp. D5.8-2]|uniref:hypothetical protein n=1 Tax=Mycolicibacterium sp. D5.8-2 TaxID=3085903 RepID=UPI00298BED58|nr:hypothetical protein [Mycolicibacterium sp. D5.8-2]MDW5614601.1 hypothetical protein [Mycolicibacterium sp. D5.8-2]